MLEQIFHNLPSDNRNFRIAAILDSLGFFSAIMDSVSGKYLPGKRTLIVKERIVRNDSLKVDLSGSLNYPCFFDAAEVKKRALEIARIYAENGYPFANITVDMKQEGSDSLRDSVIVVYKVESDLLTYFSSPLFRTIHKTSPVLLSKYVSFNNREIFDIRKVENSAKRLKNNAFVEDAVSYAPLLESDTLHSDSIFRVVVPFEIKDRSGLGFEGAAGFETDQEDHPQLRGKAEFSLLNLFHTGESITFQYQGDTSQQQFDIDFSKPYVFNTPLYTAGNFGMEIESKEYGYVYSTLKFLSEFNAFWYAGLGLEYNETSVATDSTDSTDSEDGTYYGINFLLLRVPEQYGKGVLSNEITIEVGSGIARKDKNYTRSHIDFSIGSHIPLWKSQAVLARLVTAHIVSKEEELLPVELNRVGGYNSIRGYSENEFAFRTVGYLQLEGIHYFSSSGSVFIFVDGGIGFEDEPGFNTDYTKLFGYGLGIRMPSRLGLVTIAWARNLQDKRNPGRIHVQFQNDLSLKTGKFL